MRGGRCSTSEARGRAFLGLPLMTLDFPCSSVDNPVRSRKMKIKLPWELSTVYSEHLGGLGGEEREEEDDDDIEAHEDSLQRLKVGLFPDRVGSNLIRDF